jgi:hypothetical protein
MNCDCNNKMVLLHRVDELREIHWCEKCGRAVYVYDKNNTTKTGTDMNWFVPESAK